MRVLLINQFFHPDEAATSQFLTDLARCLARRGHTVEVVCGRSVYGEPGPGGEPLAPEIVVHRCGLSGRHRGQGILGRLVDYLAFYAGAVLKIIPVRKPQVVVTLSTPPLLGALGVLCRNFKRAKFIYWVQDVYPEIAVRLGVLGRGPLTSVLEAITRAIHRRADVVVALGPVMAGKLEELHGKAAKVEVVPHWPLFSGGANPERMRDRLGWSGRFVILYSGNAGRAHEVTTFLEAFAKFAPTHPDAVLAVAGGGFRFAQVESFHQAHPELPIRILGHQPREQLADFLAAAEVHLISQLPEADGLLVPSKLYGILGSGRPLCFVGSADNEVAGVLARYSCGVRVPPGDVQGLVAAWEKMAADAGVRSGMGREALRAADELFDRDRNLARLASIMEDAWRKS